MSKFSLIRLIPVMLGTVALLQCVVAQNATQTQDATQIQPPVPSFSTPYTLTVKTQLVMLDTVVTDKKGNIVTNLNPEDFEVLENGKPQQITHFERPQAQILPFKQKITSTADLDRVAPQAPVSILVLDEMNTRFEDEAFARYSLKKYLKGKGDTLDQPTMLVAVDLHHLNVLRDYTTSKKDILNALDHHLALYPWHLSSTAQTGSWTGEIFSQAFNALMEVAEATNGHPGHKNMIWIGRGFPSVNMEDEDQASTDILKKAIETCTNMMRDARVTLYTIDPAGISTQVAEDENGFDQDVDPFDGEISFGVMAQATGGRAFFGRNDVDSLIGTSVRDGSQFYTLTYTPTDTSVDPERFHKIRVVMKNPAYKAVAREGYYPDAPPPPSHDEKGKISSRLIFDVSSAAQNMLVYDGVPLTVERDTNDADAFVVHLSDASIEWKNDTKGKRSAELAVVVVSFDRKGKMLSKIANDITLQAAALPANKASVPHSLNIRTHMKTAPPAARIRFVVRVASTGKIGAENYLLVDKKELKDPTSYMPRREQKPLPSK